MGSGLRPTFKPACPKCDFKIKYYVWDPQVHPDNWVMTAESIQHLREAHIVLPEVREAPIVIRYHRRQTVRRLPSSKRRVLV